MSGKIFSEFAPAKINLALHVTDRLDNEMHLLDSLVAFANIGDNIDAKTAKQDGLKIIGAYAPQLAKDNNNLILRALELFRKKFPLALPSGLEFELKKNLPIAAGIGGGSSDAGASLRLLVKISKQTIDKKDLHQIALKLGADVPVCLLGKTCLMQGIGEKITPTAPLPETYVVLINPLLSVATNKVFSQLKMINNEPLPTIKKPFANVQQLANWLEETRNDLLSPALEIAPIIKEITASLSTTRGCYFARMSGSGATVFALYDKKSHVENATRKLQKKWPKFWIESGRLL